MMRRVSNNINNCLIVTHYTTPKGEDKLKLERKLQIHESSTVLAERDWYLGLTEDSASTCVFNLHS